MISLVELVSIFGVATLTAAGASQGLYLLRRSKKRDDDQRLTAGEEESLGRPAAGAWHEPRYGKRRPVRCPIEYVADNGRHDGVLVDMSSRGWRARGTHPVTKGAVMTVQILCGDTAQRITIEEAVVRWTDGVEFGVEVTRISPDSAGRLSEYLTRLYPPPEPTPAYALSPFSYN